jgi:hypothetical protein
VSNEFQPFQVSNLRGTVAMAKSPGDPNSATSQWFVNLADNTNLNVDNGGFTVFARGIGGGMSNVDRIGRLQTYNLTDTNPSNFFNSYDGMFLRTPLKNHDTNKGVFISSFVLISNVVKFPAALSSDPNAVIAELTSSNTVQVNFRGFPSNPVTVSVHSYDSSTNLQTVLAKRRTYRTREGKKLLNTNVVPYLVVPAELETLGKDLVAQNGRLFDGAGLQSGMNGRIRECIVAPGDATTDTTSWALVYVEEKTDPRGGAARSGPIHSHIRMVPQVRIGRPSDANDVHIISEFAFDNFYSPNEGDLLFSKP